MKNRDLAESLMASPDMEIFKDGDILVITRDERGVLSFLSVPREKFSAKFERELLQISRDAMDSVPEQPSGVYSKMIRRNTQPVQVFQDALVQEPLET